MGRFEIHADSFIGVATDVAIGNRGLLLATAAGTVTPTFYPIPFADQAVGTGDAVVTVFTLSNPAVTANSQYIYVNAVLQVEGTDYTFVDATGEITFAVAPADTLPITATYEGSIKQAVLVTIGQELEFSSKCTTITSTADVIIS